MPTVESFTYNGYDPWPDKMKYPINVHDSIFIVPFGKLNIPFEELKGGDDDVN